jgi:hypothetical protein
LDFPGPNRPRQGLCRTSSAEKSHLKTFTTGCD